MAHRASDWPKQVSASDHHQLRLILGPDQKSVRPTEPSLTTSCVTCRQEVTRQYCNQSGIQQKSVGSVSNEDVDRLSPYGSGYVAFADGTSTGTSVAALQFLWNTLTNAQKKDASMSVQTAEGTAVCHYSVVANAIVVGGARRLVGGGVGSNPVNHQ